MTTNDILYDSVNPFGLKMTGLSKSTPGVDEACDSDYRNLMMLPLRNK